MIAECVCCESDFAETGYAACVSCMEEHGTTDPLKLLEIGAHQAMVRRNERERARIANGPFHAIMKFKGKAA